MVIRISVYLIEHTQSALPPISRRFLVNSNDSTAASSVFEGNYARCPTADSVETLEDAEHCSFRDGIEGRGRTHPAYRVCFVEILERLYICAVVLSFSFLRRELASRESSMHSFYSCDPSISFSFDDNLCDCGYNKSHGV